MAIRFQCEHCRQTLSAPLRAAGRRVTCPACKEPTIVPAAESADDLEVADPPPPAMAPVPAGRGAAGTATATRPELAVAVDAPPVRFGRARRGEDDEMDLTPMVDVVFLLLIFFMITASFSRQKSLEVPPPDPEKKGAQQSQDFLEELEDVSIRVLVDADNRVTVDEEPVADVSALSDVFTNLRIREDKTELLLTANDAALHETVVKVIDAAQDAGLERIRMTSGIEDE